jgi:hypothetical protein
MGHHVVHLADEPGPLLDPSLFGELFPLARQPGLTCLDPPVPDAEGCRDQRRDKHQLQLDVDVVVGPEHLKLPWAGGDDDYDQCDRP